MNPDDGASILNARGSRSVVAVGSDHLGADLKAHLVRHLLERGHEVREFGGSSDVEVDYPDVAAAVARAVASGKVARAVLVCGTGLGMAITANKVPGVRGASVTDVYSAERASRSNGAQVLCLGGLVLGDALAAALLDAWLASWFDDGRAGRTVAKISALDAEFLREETV